MTTAARPIGFAVEEAIPPEQRNKEVARLTRAGFVAGAIEHLMSAPGAEGLSVVGQFRTAKSAHAEVAFGSKPPAGVKQTYFQVPGIPGALGFNDTDSQSSGHNIAFSTGTHYYLVGVGFQKGMPAPPTQAQLISAAERLYKRAQHA